MFGCCKAKCVKALKGTLLSTREVITKIEPIESMSIKKEPSLDEQTHGGASGFGHYSGGTVQTKTSRDKTGHEVIEILDSDSEEELPVSNVKTEGGKEKEVGMALENHKISGENKKQEFSSPASPFDPSKFTEKSGTIWTDSNHEGLDPCLRHWRLEYFLIYIFLAIIINNKYTDNTKKKNYDSKNSNNED